MTKQVRQAITPTHILGSTGTDEGDDLGFRALASFAGDLDGLITNTRAVRSDATDTGSVTTSHTRVVVASEDSTASGDRSAVVASSDSEAIGGRSAVVASLESKAIGLRSAVVASQDSEASGGRSVVVGSEGSEASGLRSAVVASQDSEASGGRSAVVGSEDSKAGGLRSAVVVSRRTINNTDESLALGDAASGDPSTANRTIHLFGSNGNVSIAGTLTQNATFTDFAELMPNATGAEIAPGTLLTLDDGAVRPADEGEDICGVVSHTAAVLAGDTPFCWQGRYLTDEWGRRVYHDIPDADWEPEEGQTEADRPMQTVLKESPDWNPELPQVPRTERPDEWTPVGLVGQVFVRTGEQVAAGDRIGAKGGLGFKATERTGLKVMAVTKDYDGEYGIARCLINVQV